MTQSRGVVLETIEFRGPARIAIAKGEDADIAYVSYAPPDSWAPSREGIDEWGCVWRTLNPDLNDQGQVVEHPLADWARFDQYRFPDPFAPGRFRHVAPLLKKYRDEGKFVCGSLGAGPMHRLDYLRGFENYLIDLAADPERIELLLERVFGFLSGLVEQYAGLGVDAVFLLDDQAMQSGPLFSMDMWCHFFAPRYRDLFSQAHRYGMKVYMHTCGNIAEHLPELVACGVDVIDNKQPALWMDSEQVGRVRGKVTFSTCLDIQSTIHRVSDDQIEYEVARLIDTLSVPGGGFIATYYHQPDLQLPGDKVARMMQVFQERKSGCLQVCL